MMTNKLGARAPFAKMTNDAPGAGAGLAIWYDLASLSQPSQTNALAGQTITGTEGDDTLTGGFGDDLINGLGGYDHIVGGDGNDEIHGGGGTDEITDEGGDGDRIYGEDDNDIIHVGRYGSAVGSVTVSGGFGYDHISFYIMAGSAIVVDAGYSDDEVLIAGLRGSATITLGQGADILIFGVDLEIFPASLVVTDFDTSYFSGDRIEWTNFLAGNLTNWNPLDNPFGTGHLRLLQSGADTIVQIDRNGGGDSWSNLATLSNVSIASLSERHFDGYHPDGSPPDLNLGGTAGPDVLNGAAGDDTLFGFEGNDELNGNAGNDYMDGGTGNDVMRGGFGDDMYVVDSAGDQVVEVQGGGVDTIIADRAVYVLPDQVENLRTVGYGDPRDLRGNALSNLISGGVGNDMIRAQDGGNDKVETGGGVDSIYFGAAFNAFDFADGGDNRDSLILQGNYQLVFVYAPTGGSSILGIEGISLLSGAVATYGDAANKRYSYDLTMIDANVAAGGLMKVNGFNLLAGENFTFRGSAETDAAFQLFAGFGTDRFEGGAQGDAFIFGHDGRFGAGDSVDGGGGYDVLYLRGDYVIDFRAPGFAGSLVNVESIALLTSANTEFARGGDGDFDYAITWNDAMLATGATLTVNGSRLQSFESFVFNGSFETGGNLRVFGGAAADSLRTGGGADQLHGGGGADELASGYGLDLFRYSATSDSTAAARDTILDFEHGVDKIDVGRVDAKAATVGENEAFAFIGANPFSAAGPNASGQLRAFAVGGDLWRVEADVNGDGAADLVIDVHVAGSQPLTVADFIV